MSERFAPPPGAVTWRVSGPWETDGEPRYFEDILIAEPGRVRPVKFVQAQTAFEAARLAFPHIHFSQVDCQLVENT